MQFHSPAFATSQPGLSARYLDARDIDPLPSFFDRCPDWRATADSKKHNRRQVTDDTRSDTSPLWLLVCCVFLPYAFGFYLSFLYRTIMALLSTPLAAEFALTPADLGLLASMYFLSFAAVQLPLGICLDRFGPKRVQLVLLTIATVGAAQFALAESFTGLMIGRTMIGLGVAGALMAGLKAIVLWFPPGRLALTNGIFIMLGGLGAITATVPLEPVLAVLGWRGLSILLTIATAFAACLVFLLAPDRRSGTRPSAEPTMSLTAIYTDARFWRIAPLSGCVIGSAWALQGLWAVPWFADVEGLTSAEIMQHLMYIAIGLSLGAFLFGFAADRLKRHGFSTADVLAGATCLSLTAQLSLILRLPIEPLVPWIMIGALGAGTALSYTSLSETFPKSASARANGALNLLHMGMAFIVQAALGFVIELWPEDGGRYPIVAYQTAFGLNLALQATALAWFLIPRGRIRQNILNAHPYGRNPRTHQTTPTPYDLAAAAWNQRFVIAQRQVKAWRLAAVLASGLVLILAIGISIISINAVVVSHVLHG